MAFTPALHANSTESFHEKGKKASEARTEPSTSPADFSIAMRTLLTLLGCPDPIPKSLPPFAMVMALDFTCFTTLQANLMSSSCSAVGFASETVVKVISSGESESAS